jgi:dTDP-4-dehydrorhamnose 3,5-epimerase
MIDGVKIIDIKKHSDNRGFLCEMFKKNKDIKSFEVVQSNFTVAYPGVIKAFHWHKKQKDLWYCVFGNIEVVLYDRRPKSKTKWDTQTITIGENNSSAVLIPEGVAHGYRVLGNKDAGLVYFVNKAYDSNNPDEERIPHDDQEINFKWITQPR